MTERWLPVPGYEGRYSVSDQGRVRSEARSSIRKNGMPLNLKERILKPVPLPASGHLRVGLMTDGKAKMFLVHRLVLTAFVRPPEPGEEACHYPDYNPANNRLENLMWGTRSVNQQQRVEMGRHENARKTECKREHPLEGDNLLIDSQGKRQCRTCNNSRAREYRAKRKVKQ